MNNMTKSRGREKGFLKSDSSQLNSSHLSKLILSTLMTLPILLPALFSSCSHSISDSDDIYMTRRIPVSISKGSDTLHDIDIFTFDDDQLNRLDSYTKFSTSNGECIELKSRNGKKIVFACANSQRSSYDWADISSLASMDKTYADLRYDNPKSPLMTAISKINASDPVETTLSFRCLMSEIVLRSVRCDFSGRPYEGLPIKNARVYLTNVNSRCSITSEGCILPAQIVNGGALNIEETEEFNYPEMLIRNIDGDITDKVRRTEISLYCYPNASPEYSPGTPFTRLVLEGEIDGTVYWWPININRSGEIEEGIYRNRRYIYDLTILRTGSSDPDSAIEKECAEIIMEIKPWDEKEEYTVYF